MNAVSLVTTYTDCLAAAVSQGKRYFALGSGLCRLAKIAGEDLGYRSSLISQNCASYDSDGYQRGNAMNNGDAAAYFVYIVTDSTAAIVVAAQGCYDTVNSGNGIGYDAVDVWGYDNCLAYATANKFPYFALTNDTKCLVDPYDPAMNFDTSTGCTNVDSSGHNTGGPTAAYVYLIVASQSPPDLWVKIASCSNGTSTNRLLFSKSVIIQKAAVAAQIKFCTKDSRLDCVVSFPETFPIQMLRQGRTVSFSHDTLCNSGCRRDTWAGPPGRLEALRPQNDGSYVPGSKLLDVALDNDSRGGLFLTVESNFGFNFYAFDPPNASCGWIGAGAAVGIDVYINLPPPSLSPSPSYSPLPSPSPGPNITTVCQALETEYRANMTNSNRSELFCNRFIMRDFLRSKNCTRDETCGLWICPNVVVDDLHSHCV